MVDDAPSEEGSNAAGKALAIFVGGVVATYFVFGWLEGRTAHDTLWNTVYAGVGGVVALFFAFKHLRDRQLMKNTPTSRVRSLAVGDVEVEGRARPVGEPLVSPLTHSQACVYRLTVQRKWESDDKSVWETVLELDERPCFRIDDGTGQILVDAEDAELEIAEEKRVHVGSGEQPPDQLGAWAAKREVEGDEEAEDEAGLVDTITDVGDAIGDAVASAAKGSPEEHLTEDSLLERRYIERVVGVDETTYVFGGAYPREGVQDQDNADNLVIREHAGTGEFIVGDRPEEVFVDEKLVSVALFLAIAVALIPAGIVRALLVLRGG